jgi:peptidoglycan/xylan/chitin deacetylase (PgdA/CDA1 family)
MKKFLFALLHVIGVTRFAAWFHRQRVVFLCYHGVTKRPTRSPDDPKGLHVNLHRFTAQLDFLQRHYRIVSLSDYLNARNGGPRLPPYSVVLTFDDGFRNFLTVAAPALTARKIPATVFLITDKASEQTASKANNNWSPQDDEEHLSWAEARILKDKHGFEFGSHTCSHSGLLTLSTDETERELLHSYNSLITELAVEAPGLSYPKGQYSRLLADDARKLGYACAVTTDRGPNELDHDLFTLGRSLIGDDDDIASFAVRASGLRWWLVALRSFFEPRPAEKSQRLERPRPAAAAATGYLADVQTRRR